MTQPIRAESYIRRPEVVFAIPYERGKPIEGLLPLSPTSTGEFPTLEMVLTANGMRTLREGHYILFHSDPSIRKDKAGHWQLNILDVMPPRDFHAAYQLKREV